MNEHVTKTRSSLMTTVVKSQRNLHWVIYYEHFAEIFFSFCAKMLPGDLREHESDVAI